MTMLEAVRFTDRDLIESIVQSFFIVDYGFISDVNADGTINVVHAKKSVTLDGTELPEFATKNIELLTLSCAEFSVKLTPKKGDNVLLLGLKDYVKTAAGITQATKNEIFVHYRQNTIKAVPLSLFSDDAKVQLVIEDGDINLSTDGNITIQTDGTVSVKADTVEANCTSFVVKSDAGTALEVTP